MFRHLKFLISTFVCRNVEEDGALEADISNGDDQSTGESPSAEHIKVNTFEIETLSLLSPRPLICCKS